MHSLGHASRGILGKQDDGRTELTALSVGPTCLVGALMGKLATCSKLLRSDTPQYARRKSEKDAGMTILLRRPMPPPRLRGRIKTTNGRSITPPLEAGVSFSEWTVEAIANYRALPQNAPNKTCEGFVLRHTNFARSSDFLAFAASFKRHR